MSSSLVPIVDDDDADVDMEPSLEEKLLALKELDDARAKALAKEQEDRLEAVLREQRAAEKESPDDFEEKRFNYLLKRTGIYSDFLAGHTARQLEARMGRAASATPTKRGRRTEAEEDADLLKGYMEEDELFASGFVPAQPSWLSGGTMRDYQLQGLNWLVKTYNCNVNAILADEMGLGKTMQSISLLGWLRHERGQNGPHLVIAPKSTISNWVSEIRRWVPSLTPFKFHGNKEERKVMCEELAKGGFDVIVTTYEMTIIEKAALKKIPFHYIVIDEAQRIKNEKSKLSVVLRSLSSRNRLLLTGTPLQNNLHELWALLNYLLPNIFYDSEDFDSWLDKSKGEEKEKQQKFVDMLHKVLRPFLLRRLKSDVEHALLPKKEVILSIGMSAMQKEWYRSILSKDLEAVNDYAGEASKVRLLNIVMQLRKCCNHPYLFNGAEPGPPYTNGEHLVTTSGKMILLDKLLPKLQAQGSRVLIFSQMTRLLDILEDYLVLRDYQYCRIDGSTSGEDRDEAIAAYNEEGSEKFVFLLSTRAGGLGINLATADIVIIYDSDWNPQVDLQAQDRAHRIGQKKAVVIYRFVTKDSVEDKIVERAQAKLHLDTLVIQQGRLAAKQRSVQKNELLNMIRHGVDQVFLSDGSSVTDEDIEHILKRGEERTAEMTNKMKSKTESLLDRFAMDEEVDLYTFEGRDYGGELRGVKRNFVSLPRGARKRTRKGTNYSVDEYYRSALKAPKARKVPKALRRPKQQEIHDFQFYPPRLQELYDKQNAAFDRKSQARLKEIEDAEKGIEPAPPADESSSSPPDYGELTEAEIAERDHLLTQGFGNWGKRDFSSFLKGCEIFGRENIEAIARKINKPEEEVARYSAAFWKNYALVKDHERYIANIEKGERKIQRKKDMIEALNRKVESYANPWKELSIAYSQSKGKMYTLEEDRFILCTAHKLGYGRWDDVKLAVRLSTQFRFDWFFKSRTPIELSRRCDALIRMIQKEQGEKQ